MQSKRKKFWIILSSVLLSFVIVIIVIAAVFRVQTVEVELRTRLSEKSNLPDQIREKVISSGEFDYGKNIFFYNCDQNIAKIEKNIPFVKVEQVIKYFPQTIRVYISERVAKFRVQDNQDPQMWYILDEDLKVLRQVSSADLEIEGGFGESTIEVTKSTFSVHAEEGDFISNDAMKSRLNQVATGVYGRTRDWTKISSISFADGDAFSAEIVMKNKDVKIIIEGAEELSEKVFVGVSLFYLDDGNINPDIEDGSIITIVKNSQGKYEARLSKTAS